jgi:cyclic nucleotide-binding protein
MRLSPWRLPRVRTGDWRVKLLVVSQVAVGITAVFALLAMVTRDPLLLLAFSATQGVMVVGVILFVVVAIFSQRTLVKEKYLAGETIFREGEPGRHVYVVASGRLEVFRTRPDGIAEPLKELGPGDPFGEMALLRQAPRNATIRALTAVEVYKMSPGNFAALYANLPGLREHFNTLMESRLRELEGPR